LRISDEAKPLEGEVDTFWKTILWQQFGAAIDMLENTVRACPNEIWSDPSKRPQWVSNDVVGFWYLVYHTLFFLDYNLSDSAKGFAPPLPFNLDELDPAGLLPARPYTKDELLPYVEHCRLKCRTVIEALTEERARQRCGFDRPSLSVAELLLYTMRHTQHHVAQLNLILRQKTSSAPNWVDKTRITV
jgi:DinB superfamily